MKLLEKLRPIWYRLVGRPITAPHGPGSYEEFQRQVGDRVFFDFEHWDLTQAAKDQLRRQADYLLKHAPSWILVEGHCDERGTREENLTLGERRANTVKSYLAALGVPANSMQVVSYGRERPAVIGSNDVAWSQNRRVVVVIG